MRFYLHSFLRFTVICSLLSFIVISVRILFTQDEIVDAGPSENEPAIFGADEPAGFGADEPAGFGADEPAGFGADEPVPPKPPFRPFLADEPKYLVILSYQRSGSSPMGMFFNTNPDVFYYFEPIDSFYSSIYGTKQGWSIPTDIMTRQNGTLRNLPHREVEGVSEFLRQILKCNVFCLPTETLVHRFFSRLRGDFNALSTYINCLERKDINAVIAAKECQSRIKSFCERRMCFTTDDAQDTCYKLMRNERVPLKKVPQNIQKEFFAYRSCMKILRTNVENSCLPIFRETCTRSQMRVVKVVRASMESMEPLLMSLPNFRLIHLIRDPRAVMLSRADYDTSARGCYPHQADPTSWLMQETRAFCNTVVRDIAIRRRLEESYPGRIYPLIMEEVFSDPVSAVSNIYNFMEERVAVNTYKWIQRSKNMTRNVYKWKHKIKSTENQDILKACQEFYRVAHSSKWRFGNDTSE